MNLQYHQATFDLLNITPEIDDAAVTALAEVEKQLNIRLRVPVREWYSLKNTANHIAGRQDHVLSVEQFALINRTTRPAWDWLNNYADDDMVQIMIDHEERWLWAIHLDVAGMTNPSVLTCPNGDPGRWDSCGDFSKFIYHRAWDTLLWRSPYVLTALAQPYSDERSNFLDEHFGMLSAGATRPATNGIRYAHPLCRILVEANLTTFLEDWYVAAENKAALHQFLTQLQEAGSHLFDDILHDFWQAYEKAEA